MNKKNIILFIILVMIVGLTGCDVSQLGTHRAQRKRDRIAASSGEAAPASANEAETEEETEEEEAILPIDAGEYELDSIEVSGMTLDSETLKMAGLLPENNYIKLGEDFNGVMCFEGNNTDFVWEAGAIRIGTENIPYTRDENKITARFSDALLGGSLGDDAIITYSLRPGTGYDAPEKSE